MTADVGFWRFLDGLLEIEREDLADWLGRLNCSADLSAAMRDGCVGGARTAIAAATWRSWPRGEDVPAPVRAALEVLGVRVRW